MTHPEHDHSAHLSALLGPDGAFASSWLDGKSVAPVPISSQVDAALTRRISAGCRAVGTTHILHAPLTGGSSTLAGPVSRLATDSGHEGVRPPSILWTPDRQGAVLLPEAGYALIGGVAAFMAAAVGEGVDTARARFRRYARTLSDRHPHLLAVADAHQSLHRAWLRPSDVESGSAAAEQLRLLDDFSAEVCSAPEFAHAWWEARRASQASGERIQGPLEDLFGGVFMLLEDYAVDPDLREPGDLSDAELLAAVRHICDTFRRSM